jgi:hypothetical protein
VSLDLGPVQPQQQPSSTEATYSASLESWDQARGSRDRRPMPTPT